MTLVIVSVSVTVTVTVTVSVSVIVITLIVIIMAFVADTFIDRDTAVGRAADARACVRRVATGANCRNRGHLWNKDAIEPRIGCHRVRTGGTVRQAWYSLNDSEH